jgi:hypothetical protein
MITSPVGARCPSCARIDRPAILNTSSSDIIRAIMFAIGAAVVGAVAVSVLLWIMVELPLPFGLFCSDPCDGRTQGTTGVLRLVELVVVAGGMAGIGYLVGEAVKYGSGKKLDRRLKYVATLGVFVGWVATISLLPVFNVQQSLGTGTGGIIGLIVSYYVATYRVRV